MLPGRGDATVEASFVEGNTHGVAGHDIVGYVGIVRGIVVRATSMGKGIIGGFKALGLALPGMAAAAIPAVLLWLGLGIFLGKRYRDLADRANAKIGELEQKVDKYANRAAATASDAIDDVTSSTGYPRA